MKRFISGLIILISCDLHSQDLNAFRDFLGEQEYKSLELAVKTWENFLNDNYNLNTEEASHQFIATLFDSSFSDNSKWIFKSSNFEHVLNEIRKSGLQGEIWIYNNEEHFDDEVLSYTNSLNRDYHIIDTSGFNTQFEELVEIPPVEDPQLESEEIFRVSNQLSRLSAAIHKYSTNNLIRQGAEINLTLGSISPHLIMNALINNRGQVDYTDFITKAFIVQSIFYDFMYYHAPTKK